MSAGDPKHGIEAADPKLGQASLSRSVLDPLAAVIELAHQLERMHEQDRLHLRISYQTALWNEQGQLLLPPPQDEATFGGEFLDEELCPLALRTSQPITLPSQLPAARRVLQDAKLSFPPEAIDLYQLGTLLCRLLTGESISSYLRSPKTKSLVPPAVQEVIDRALAHEPRGAFQNLTEFAEALSQIDSPLEKTRLVPNDPAKEDTAPSILGQKSERDTSLVAPGQNASPSQQPMLPFERLGHYEILERIGQGGMGHVYQAYERTLDRTVALKVLPAELSRSEDFVRRFYAEATAAARLVHPNIVQIYYIGEDQGHHFFAMQYVQGESLADLLAARGKLGLEESVTILQQALSGLAAAHKLGLVHRDIKPGNILLEPKMRKVYLADFGLVKSLDQAEGMTTTGTVLGTVDYISPEQGRGQPVDPRADLYSLGVVFYRMLSGRLPFEADSPTSMIFQHVYEPPPPLRSFVSALPSAYSRIVEKLLAKDPADRYPSAEAVQADLKAAHAQQSLPQEAGGSQESKSSFLPSGEKSSSQFATTQLIAVPDFGASPALPKHLDAVAPTGWWPRLQNRMWDYVSKQAPELYDRLQSTQQQVDRAVAVYDRRERKLNQLAQEAQSVLDLLIQERDAWKQTAGQKATLEENAGASGQAELESQIAQQREQREEILRQCRQVRAKREQLALQRDLLNARLKVAHARLQIAGGRSLSDSRGGISSFLQWVQCHKKWIVGGVCGLALLMIVAWSFNPSPPSSPTETTVPEPGVLTNSLHMTLVQIPAGTFHMGSTPRQRAEASKLDINYPPHFCLDEIPRHLVRMTKPFYMSRHEVTREQFAEFISQTGYKTDADWKYEMSSRSAPPDTPPEEQYKWNHAGFEQSSDHPVVHVSWNDAVKFCEWLSRKEGVTYRLPTEAEWEYACRAGLSTQYQTGDDPEELVKVGNVADQTLQEARSTQQDTILKPADPAKPSSAISSRDGYVFTAPVGHYQPNAFGLYDMQGNVAEWCQDFYAHNYYGNSPTDDPPGPATGKFRTFRGGHWKSTPGFSRMCNRSRQPPNYFDHIVGFRVVREMSRE